MDLVPSGLKPLTLTPGAILSVLTIEPGSANLGLLQRRLRRQSKQWGFTIEVSRTLQSFTSIVQMARHGFGHGLVPESVARARGIRSRPLVHLPKPTLTRPVSPIGPPHQLIPAGGPTLLPGPETKSEGLRQPHTKFQNESSMTNTVFSASAKGNSPINAKLFPIAQKTIAPY